MTKVPYSTTELNDYIEEAYCDREEYQKEKTTFEESVHTHLPNLLNNDVLNNANELERNMSFLSSV